MNKDYWENIVNDQASYKKFYADYYIQFFNYGRKFTTSNTLIEDAIQDVFLDIWIKKDKLSQVNSIAAYLFSSFRYTLLRKIKAEKKMVGSEEIVVEPEFSIDYIIVKREMDNELQEKLKIALNGLTPHQREAIFLRFYQNLSYEEVADILNISVKATYKIVARSLIALKSNMHVYMTLLANIFHS